MVDTTKETEIAAPPEKVFEYLLDFARHPEWTTPGHGVKITASVAGPAKVGATFISDAHQFGAQHDQLTVTELVPNQRLVYESVMKDGNRFRHTLELTPTAAGTRLRKRFQSLKLNLTSTLMSPIGMIVAPRFTAADLQRIKRRLETPTST